MKLLLNAIIKYIVGLAFAGALVFLPAGSFGYANGWLFIGLLFVPMFVLGTVLFIKAPNLLEKRLGVKEKENTQKGVVAASGLMFIAGFLAVAWIVFEKLAFGAPVTNQPLFYFSLTAMVLGVQLFIAGFLGELINRRSSDRNHYLIDERIE